MKKRHNILEIGFGEGHNMNLLSKNKENKVVGVDLSKEIVNLTKKRYPNLDVYQMNAEKLKFKNQTALMLATYYSQEGNYTYFHSFYTLHLISYILIVVLYIRYELHILIY